VATGASTWPALLTRLLRGEALAADETAWAMEQVMLGEATPAQVAGFVVALRAKGESPDEVSGLVTAMLGHAERIDVTEPAVDTCGTGGDRAHTVNISTMSAMVVAGTGARVVKHGNRAASSACGSADLLEELGVVVDLSPELVVECVDRAGIAFCFAPRFHPALRHAAAARRELGVATVFNFLGPLANPAQPGAQAVGVADPRMAAVMAQVLADRGVSALVFRGDDGLDELTPCETSQVWVVRDGQGTSLTNRSSRSCRIETLTLTWPRSMPCSRSFLNVEHASFSTHAPSSLISPQSSATAMNSTGETTPSCESFQRASASKPPSEPSFRLTFA
jgi:anthranilate phosphoribosyltransferase